MKRIRKLLPVAAFLIAAAAAADPTSPQPTQQPNHTTSPQATPTRTPAPPPTTAGETVHVEAEDHAGAMGSVRPVHAADASEGRAIETTGQYGNFVQYHFRVSQAGTYSLRLRYALGEASALSFLLEGEGFGGWCELCTAGEWFGTAGFTAPPPWQWQETTVETVVLDVDVVYTLTVRIMGSARIDWLELNGLPGPQ